MRDLYRTLLALVLAACAAAAYADPPGRVGRLSYASGTVSFAAADAPDQWTQAVLNRPLTGGDRLWADRDGYSELHVGSNAVRLAPLTSVDILYLDDDRIQLRLAQGTLQLRVRDIDRNDVIEIATPAGAVMLRQPGSYRISVDPQTGASRVAVSFGLAEVVTPAQTFAVPSGQAAALAAGGSPMFEIAAAADEFDRWSAERDRREDRVASTRYVSPNMTGYEDLDQYGSWRTLPEYGAVWVPARVAPGWAPYRYGHWAWVSPWGWTWVDDAPWGFAPFHYGRWVWVHDYWAWAPGAIVRRPVYAPALVAFVGGPNWSVSVGRGPAVGWFPLGWREPYQPWYRASPRYVQNVNVTHVTNLTNVYNVTNVHRNRAEAVTVVPRQSFVSASPVARSRISVAPAELARAEVIRDRQPAEPLRAGIAPERRAPRPPAQAQAAPRAAVSATAPVTAPATAPVAAPARERTERRREESARTVPPRTSAEAQRERPGEQRGRPEPRREPGPRTEAPDRPSSQRERGQVPQPRTEAPAPRPAQNAQPRNEASAPRPAQAAAPHAAAPAPRAQAVQQPRQDGNPRGERSQHEGRNRPGAPPPS